MNIDEKIQQRNSIDRMVRLLNDVVAGRIPRSAITAFTRELHPESSGQALVFRGNGEAYTVFDSIWNIEQHLGHEFLVRDSDLRQYISWLTEGSVGGGVDVATIRGKISERAEQSKRVTTRFWIDGLGWHEDLSVVSPYTGRTYVCVGQMEPLDGVETFRVLTARASDDKTIEDLFDTFAIDWDDVVYPAPQTGASWRLWRQDDNGVQAVISTFSGRMKSQIALEHFESLHHKQMYWLEEFNSTG
jgi:hypothetical protein